MAGAPKTSSSRDRKHTPASPCSHLSPSTVLAIAMLLTASTLTLTSFRPGLLFRRPSIPTESSRPCVIPPDLVSKLEGALASTSPGASTAASSLFSMLRPSRILLENTPGAPSGSEAGEGKQSVPCKCPEQQPEAKEQEKGAAKEQQEVEAREARQQELERLRKLAKQQAAKIQRLEKDNKGLQNDKNKLAGDNLQLRKQLADGEQLRDELAAARRELADSSKLKDRRSMKESSTTSKPAQADAGIQSRTNNGATSAPADVAPLTGGQTRASSQPGAAGADKPASALAEAASSEALDVQDAAVAKAELAEKSREVQEMLKALEGRDRELGLLAAQVDKLTQERDQATSDLHKWGPQAAGAAAGLPAGSRKQLLHSQTRGEALEGGLSRPSLVASKSSEPLGGQGQGGGSLYGEVTDLRGQVSRMEQELEGLRSKRATAQSMLRASQERVKECQKEVSGGKVELEKYVVLANETLQGLNHTKGRASEASEALARAELALGEVKEEVRKAAGARNAKLQGPLKRLEGCALAIARVREGQESLSRELNDLGARFESLPVLMLPTQTASPKKSS